MKTYFIYFAAICTYLTLIPASQARPSPLVACDLGDPTCRYKRAVQSYQIGDLWEKEPVSPELMQFNSVYKKSVMGTARFIGMTAFYLGKFGGLHLMATNNHVFGPRVRCHAVSVSFDYAIAGKRFRCAQKLANWYDIDLAIFAIEVTSLEDEKALAQIAMPFDFNADIYPGQPITTAGYGSFGNRVRGEKELMVSRDRDCYVFSDFNDFRRAPDPSDPWTFAMGCDLSPGDSGSAVLDRDSGKVIGIVYGGINGKPEPIRSSDYLDRIFNHRIEEDIWRHLTYTVPAKKIAEVIRKDLHWWSTKLNSATKSVLRKMLEAK